MQGVVGSSPILPTIEADLSPAGRKTSDPQDPGFSFVSTELDSPYPHFPYSNRPKELCYINNSFFSFMIRSSEINENRNRIPIKRKQGKRRVLLKHKIRRRK